MHAFGKNIANIMFYSVIAMVFILDGNSEIVAHVDLFIMHLIRSTVVTNRIFLHACATCSELPSSISTMAITE